MPDPIRDLENFPVTPVQPLPAAEVRRRGDRMRRRRSIAAGGLAVAAVVAVASLGVAVGALPGDDRSAPAPAGPATTAPDLPVPKGDQTLAAVLGPVTDAHLLTDDDLVSLAGAQWSIGQTVPDGEETALTCDEGWEPTGNDDFALSHMGEDVQEPRRIHQVQRVWHVEGITTLLQTVVSYPTAQVAENVAETTGATLQRCAAPYVQDWTPTNRDHEVRGADQSFVVDATWHEGGPMSGTSGLRSVVGVVRVDNRVSVLSLDGPVGAQALDIGGPDTAETPVDALVEKVVERLSATP